MSLSLRAWLWIAVALATALRLPTLDVQSLWADEAVTASVTGGSLAHVFSAVWSGESTPPLFYLLEWPFIKLLGDGETALRLLPAVFSIATVPLAGMIGARIAQTESQRVSAGAIAALLCATNPLLIWFGQEARAYSLLGLLAAASVLLVLRAVARPAPGRLAAWAAVAILALATHWFAVFLLVAEAVWLMLRLRRVAIAPVAAVAAAVAAGLPLLLHQRDQGLASFIGDSSLISRLSELPKQFLVGYDAPLEIPATVLTAALVVAVVASAAARAPWRGELRVVAAFTATALVLPLGAALIGQDYVITRNLLPALVVAVPVVAAALATLDRLGIGAAAALAAIWAALAIGVTADTSYQRDDWRSAIASLGDPPGQRLVIITPASGRPAADYYLGQTSDIPAHSIVSQIAVVAIAAHDPGRERLPRSLPPSPPGLFTTTTRADTWISKSTEPGRRLPVVGQTVADWGGPLAAGLIEH